jgi:phospholipase C
MQDRKTRNWLLTAFASAGVSMAVFTAGVAHAGSAATPVSPDALTTTTPIKHVVLIIGENRTFDHLFGTFTPNAGQTVSNLLSKGIVNANGTPGPNFNLAQQWLATDTTKYSISPTKTSAYSVLPDVNTDGTPTSPPFNTVAEALAVEPALPGGDYIMLTTGGSGLPSHVIDTRFGASPQNLPNGPFDIGQFITYDDYAGSPVHRFYQMWQQLDCDITKATAANPSGCQEDLFPWVEDTIGAGSNGNPQPSPFTDQTTNEGSIAMGFYNASAGDMSYFNSLAHQYALSDNFHQSIQGGTGANHLAQSGHPADQPDRES